MAFIPKEKTKKFIDQVNSLVDSGIVPSYLELADNIDWNRSAMSNVINGRRNVPNDVYKRFTDVYKPVEIKNVETFTIEKLLRIEAMSSVIISALAEVLAFQRNQNVAKVTEDLLSTVNSKLKQLTER